MGFKSPKTETIGRIGVYLISNDDPPREAVGMYTPVYFTSGSAVQDVEGPAISFETGEGRILQSGDHFRTNENLVVRLADSLGINLAGESGHEISMTDLSNREISDITSRFIYDPNSVHSGTIIFAGDEFSNEIHIRIKAWDSANNPSEKEIYLIQTESNSLQLFHVTNYPNPFESFTQFIFEISTDAEISIDVYTLGGQKVKSFSPRLFDTGFHTIDWTDGKDSFGGELANGTYLYNIKAKANGSTISKIGKIAKFR